MTYSDTVDISIVACDGLADVILMIDTSGSIRENRFGMVTDWARQVVEQLEVTDNRIRVGVLAFSDNAIVVSDLNTHMRKEDILQV